MADTDWVRIAIEGAGWAASSLVGLVVGAWRGGRRSAHHDQWIKDDYDGKITKLREDTRAAMEKYTESADARNSLLIEQFKESFEGIRRQFDEHRLGTERDFVRKDEFRVLREEIREDMREIKTMIQDITRR